MGLDKCTGWMKEDSSKEDAEWRRMRPEKGKYIKGNRLKELKSFVNAEV